ncbi:class I SAM-dependent methyltransferase [Pseudoteredinibacter isoporae]|uniref:class I SAM-dependent methyltransferase n=1 Tax=Pseudoteredinibacter isoporae TaxID=570281 RepID=UPI003103EBB4
MSSQISWSDYWQTGAEQSLQAHAASPVKQFVQQYFVSKLKDQDSVLDLATGNGALLQQLPESHTGFCVGVDYSDIVPNTDLRHQHHFIRMDGSSLAFPDHSFSWVVSQFGFEYIPRESGIRELCRVLQPTSQLLLLCHRKDSLLCRHSQQQLMEGRSVLDSGLFAAAWQWCQNAHTDKTDRVGLQKLMASMMNEIRLPRESSLMFALLRSLAQLLTDVRDDKVRSDLAQQMIGQWQSSLLANIDRLEQQISVALSGADQKNLVDTIRASGFKAKTVALAEQGRPLAWGMYFSREQR